MEDKCVCCGTYVPEGRMVCLNCEEKAKERHFGNKKVPLWRKILIFLLSIVICFAFTACSGQKTNELEPKKVGMLLLILKLPKVAIIQPIPILKLIIMIMKFQMFSLKIMQYWHLVFQKNMMVEFT